MLESKLLKLSFLAILFGSIYTIFRKYQSCAQLTDPTKSFNQPLQIFLDATNRVQSFLIFIGMASVGFIQPLVSAQSKTDQRTSEEQRKPRASPIVFLIPSVLDVGGTVVDTAGLFYVLSQMIQTSVSVSQMLKGSVICFTYLISIFYLNKKLSVKKHILMLVILVSLVVIGSCNLDDTEHSKYESNPLLGNSLIVLSQLMFSFMFIVEEKLLNKYEFGIVEAVSWEGLWGVGMSAILLFIFANTHQNVVQCDIFESCELIYKNPNLLLVIVLTCLSIGPFNYFGMSITKQASALHRCLVCTFRMVVVWVCSLLLGWQRFSFIQLLGYLVLTVSIFEFNKNEYMHAEIDINADIGHPEYIEDEDNDNKKDLNQESQINHCMDQEVGRKASANSKSLSTQSETIQ